MSDNPPQAAQRRRFDAIDLLAIAGIGMLVASSIGGSRTPRTLTGTPRTPPGHPIETGVDTLRAAEPGRGRQSVAPWHIPWAGWKDILWRTYAQITQDRLLAVAAGVVFYGLLALFPAITAFVSVYGLLFDIGTVQDQLVLLSDVVPADAMGPIAEQVQRVVSAGNAGLSIAFIFGLLLAFWSANAGMKAIIDALNVAYDETERRSFIRLNLISMTMTLGAVAAGLIGIASVVVFPIALSYLGISSAAETIVSLLRWPVLFAALLLGLAVLYRFGPNRREARWQWLTVGSVFATVAWLVGSSLLSLYLSQFANYNATYGSLAAGIGLMMWMWLSAIIVLLGAELNAEIEHQTARDTTVGADRPLGRRGAVVADTVGAAQD